MPSCCLNPSRLAPSYIFFFWATSTMFPKMRESCPHSLPCTASLPITHHHRVGASSALLGLFKWLPETHPTTLLPLPSLPPHCSTLLPSTSDFSLVQINLSLPCLKPSMAPHCLQDEAFQSQLQTSWHIIPQYFNMCYQPKESGWTPA